MFTKRVISVENEQYVWHYRVCLDSFSGFDIKLRQKFDEIAAIDTNDVDAVLRETIWKNFDLKCDECPTEFQALNEAQVHYLNEHNMNRGYIKCCDMKLREGNSVFYIETFVHNSWKMFFFFEDHMIREHIAYHKNPDIYL